jgi:sulfite reductase (NADPH) flavoprotein alpha-component
MTRARHRSELTGKGREFFGIAGTVGSKMTDEATAASCFIPESAPFSPEQRRWLSAFFNELAALHPLPEGALAEAASRLSANGAVFDDAPWHKPKMPLSERMLLAEGRPMARRMMAAMGQQDCRQCGYDCAEYAGAIAALSEMRLNLCVPGGKDTARMLAALVAEAAGGAAAFDAEAYKARVAAANALPPPDTRPGYSRDNPVTVIIRARERLNAGGAPEAATWHIEIDLAESGLDYMVGDALGIYPQNDPALVDAVITAAGAAPDAVIGGRTLKSILTMERSLGTAPDALFATIASLCGGETRHKAKQLAAGGDPDGDAAGLDVLAALHKFPGVKPHPEALADSLDPLQPRLYSIASSLRVEPGTVALTVRHVNYEVGGRRREGVGSSWLATRGPLGSRLSAFIQRAPHFRLPADDVPVIMVGPGTGVAPFRAFLHERSAAASGSRNWLFFGHRHQATDFFYGKELEEFRRSGVLTRLSLAWSRDGDRKTYVHHKMIEEGEELFDWLYDGAHFYVCGDARSMAADVERALVDIVADYGNREEDAAREFVANLKAEGRYKTDVY